MDPFIGLLIIVLAAKAAVDKGRREYRATREHHAAQIARTHPDWHPRKVSRSAGRRAMSHWWNELAAWPPFPSLRAAFAEDRLTARAAAEEGRAEGIVRRRDLRERIARALEAQAEHAGPAVPATPEVPPRSETAGQPDPYVPRGDARPDDSDHLRPGEERCKDCGGSGRNDAGDDACPICRGWGSEADDPDAPVLPDGTICTACGNPGTEDDPVLDSGSSPVHRSHAVAQQEAYADRRAALANTNGTRQRRPVQESETQRAVRDITNIFARYYPDVEPMPGPEGEPFPEPEDDNWPTGVPHRRNGDAPSPATNGGKAMPTGTDTGIDTALEGADTPHEAMQGAFRQIGARAAEFAQAASDELAAAAAVHGMDRDPQTMSDIAALADHAQALQQQANQAATGLGQRHADGAEYHSTGTDAHASAYRPS